MKLRKLACTLPNQLYFQYFILLFFSSPAGSLPFHIFFSLLFSHPHTTSHTYSSISTLLRLSFKFPLIFVILCCHPVSSTFFLCVCLLQLTTASSHLTFLHFSLKFLTMAFLFCFFFFFFFVSHVCLFHLFLLLYFFFWLRF